MKSSQCEVYRPRGSGRWTLMSCALKQTRRQENDLVSFVIKTPSWKCSCSRNHETRGVRSTSCISETTDHCGLWTHQPQDTAMIVCFYITALSANLRRTVCSHIKPHSTFIQALPQCKQVRPNKLKVARTINLIRHFKWLTQLNILKELTIAKWLELKLAASVWATHHSINTLVLLY